ncbi:Rap1a/Tai family immunity protein [Telluria beijingensis]|uniref:Rap1a/Tai family immunity protein n=1 Tax=Telluria beijingensis TaxID=3068633 RepID=UPI002795B5AA|nr:Rap1a/Tai family immunity protein [Massilia sp. REN29]
MRRQTCLGLMLPLTALAAPYSPTMDGNRFIEMMSHPSPSGQAYLDREKAYSYLDGLRDGAEGRVWCDVSQLKTPDLAYEMASKLAQLPATERKKNASQLLLEQLGRTYPCRNGGKR